jgi:8-oxo-dGTP pyrophosphatase MutT (NUDIX family)
MLCLSNLKEGLTTDEISALLTPLVDAEHFRVAWRQRGAAGVVIPEVEHALDLLARWDPRKAGGAKLSWERPRSCVFQDWAELGVTPQFAFKAGGVTPFRQHEGRLEILLCAEQRRLESWESAAGLDKLVLSTLGGRRDDGESILDTCCREFHEETREVLGEERYSALRERAEGALSDKHSKAFGFWSNLGAFVVLFLPEDVVAPECDLIEEFRSLSAERLDELGRCSLEASDLHWVSVAALLETVPVVPKHVSYSSPSKVGPLHVVSSEGERVRLGHFLTTLLMHSNLRQALTTLLSPEEQERLKHHHRDEVVTPSE